MTSNIDDVTTFIPLVQKTIQPLQANEINFNGKVFDCSLCSNAGCCNSNCAPYCEECYICSCQGKGTIFCDLNVPCGPTCNALTSPSDPCTCVGKLDNAVIYGPSITTIQDAKQVGEILSNSKYVIDNYEQAVFQTSAPNLLECCQGSSNTTQQLCGSFWGPKNEGPCDDIMVRFCTSNTESPLCACINSPISTPECNDARCATNNTMKLSKMLKTKCAEVFLSCEEFSNLSPSNQNNVVKKLYIEQTCHLNTGTGAASSKSGQVMTALLVVGAVVFSVLIITISVLVARRNKKSV